MKYISPVVSKLVRSTILMLGMSLLFSFGLSEPLHAKLLAIDKRGGLAGAYLHPDKSPDLVEVFLFVKSGGFDDGDGPEGLAHYLEHLVWLSAVNPDGRASTARDDGAWVSGGITAYSLKGDPEQLNSYLETMAKVFGPPSLDEAFMREERDILKREYDYRLAERPLDPIVRDLQIHLFGDAPRARSVLGTPESIAKLTPEMAMALHTRTHIPANAVLFVMGNTDLATVAPLVEKHFGGIAAGDPPPRRQPPPFQERREIVETSVDGSRYQQLIYFKRIRLETPLAEDRLQLQLDLLHAILDSPLDGSIAKPLRFDDFIASSFSLNLSAIEPGEVLMTVSAVPDDGIGLSDLLTTFEDTLRAIADEGIPEATFDRVREKRFSFYEKHKGRRFRALNLMINQIGDDAEPIAPKIHIKRYGKAALEDVNGLIRALAGSGDVAAALVSPDTSD